MSSDYHNHRAIADANPPQPITCECGSEVMPGEQRMCLICGYVGCAQCVHLSTAPDAEANDEYVCCSECDLEWHRKFLSHVEDRASEIVEAVARRIEQKLEAA